MNIPKHVAVIMDGNGRWAERRKRPRIFGHIRGASRVNPIVYEAKALGIKALTVFAFSTENFQRPETEKKVLWKLLKKFVKKEAADLKKENVRMRFFGELDLLPHDVLESVRWIQNELKDNTGISFNMALSYGSRREIIQASKAFALDCLEKKITPNELTEQRFNDYLFTRELEGLADVDLLIRTSGEKRISNYLLWQAAYAEFVFSDVHWPDFTPSHFRSAVEEYSNRERRYGLTRVSKTPEFVADRTLL